MKIFILLASFSVYSMTYESTDNKSMSKFERINVNEQRVIDMGQKINSHEADIAALKSQLSELEKRVKELEAAPKTKLIEE